MPCAVSCLLPRMLLLSPILLILLSLTALCNGDPQRRDY